MGRLGQGEEPVSLWAKFWEAFLLSEFLQGLDESLQFPDQCLRFRIQCPLTEWVSL